MPIGIKSSVSGWIFALKPITSLKNLLISKDSAFSEWKTKGGAIFPVQCNSMFKSKWCKVWVYDDLSSRFYHTLALFQGVTLRSGSSFYLQHVSQIVPRSFTIFKVIHTKLSTSQQKVLKSNAFNYHNSPWTIRVVVDPQHEKFQRRFAHSSLFCFPYEKRIKENVASSVSRSTTWS